LSNSRNRRNAGHYLRRMATRATPFGLCAGVAIGRWGQQTSIGIDGTLHSITRPAVDLMNCVADTLESQSTVLHRSRVAINSAALFFGNCITLIGETNEEKVGRKTIRITRPLTVTLQLAREPIEFSKLEQSLVQEFPNSNKTQIRLFLTKLVEQRVLVSELRPPLVSNGQIADFSKRIEPHEPCSRIAHSFKELIARCAEYDNNPNDDGSGFVSLLETATRKFDCANVPEMPLKVDAKANVNKTVLSDQIRNEVAEFVELLLRLGPRPNGPRWIANYREAFIAKYGISRDVPLSTVDAELPVETFAREETHSTSPRDIQLMRIAATAIQNRQDQVDLDEALVTRLQTWSPQEDAPPPLSLEFAFSLSCRSAEDIDNGIFKIIAAPILGSGLAGRMFGRFGDVLNQELHASLHNFAEMEAGRHPEDVIFAEVVYTPCLSRFSNVVTRPRVRKYEITIGGPHSCDDVITIPLHELALGIRNLKFSLFWRKTGQQVIPCVGHMLYEPASAALIRLLQDLPFDGVPLLSRFDWGIAENAPFLPRVAAGRKVLRLAQWNPTAKELCTTSAVEEWQATWSVPRRVFLSTKDNLLPMDLGIRDHLEELVVAAQRSDETLTILEATPDTQQAWVPSARGLHCAEFVVPLFRNSPSKAVARSNEIHVPRAVRSRGGRSDWIYLCLFSPLSQHPVIIGRALRQLAEKARADHDIKTWFYVRYLDPEPHIRIRFTGEPEQLWTGFFAYFTEWAEQLIEQGLATRYTFEIYERELERYGGFDGQALAERLFAVDSTVAAAILRGAGSPTDYPGALEVCSLSINLLLSGLRLGVEDRVSWFKRHNSRRPEIGVEFRKKKATLIRLFEGDYDGLEEINQALGSMVDELDHIAGQLENSALTTSVADLYPHFVHMHCNRVLGANIELQDMAVGLAERTLCAISKRVGPARK
jgi:lantibiotic biosynthesis protein